MITNIRCQNHSFPHIHLCWQRITASSPKFFTSFGTDKPYTNFQTPLLGSTEVGLFEISFARNLYPDCTVYCPEDVYGQISLSLAEELQRGIL